MSLLSRKVSDESLSRDEKSFVRLAQRMVQRKKMKCMKNGSGICMTISWHLVFFYIMHDGLQSNLRVTTHSLITTISTDFYLVILTLSCHIGYPL